MHGGRATRRARVRAVMPNGTRTLEALADALLPPGARLPGAADVGTAARAAEVLARMPKAVRRLAAAELFALEHLSRLVPGGGRFSDLPRDRRDAVVSWAAGLPGPLADALAPL